MRRLLAGRDVPVTISLPVGATAVSWRVLGELGQELRAWASASGLVNAGIFEAVVEAVHNTVVSGTSVRTVELEIAGAEGTTLVSDSYILTATSALVALENTFASYHEALLISASQPEKNVAEWLEADRDSREIALAAAYRRVLFAPIPMLDREQLAETDPKLMAALKVAQVLQASHMLKSDEFSQMRENGVMSMTVGESSQFLRTMGPVELPLCRPALDALAGWIRWSVRAGR
jgi:hypothetical protein